MLDKLMARHPELRIIWAPRHIDRIGEIEELFATWSLPCARKSQGPTLSVHNVLWDTMGDLLDAYKQADVAVVGGSFVPKGGQNPLEPAALQVPVVFGPSMENFSEIASRFVAAGAAVQVDSPEDVGVAWIELFRDPARMKKMGETAEQLVASSRGAADRALAEIAKHLDGGAR